jgi:uncharacterized protein (DUF1810 family)
MDDPFDLQRFVDAQEPVYRQARAELAAGAKASHWMWFVFPQLATLGRSATAKRFGMASLAEAQAYWQHPVLGRRLQECAELLLTIEGRTALQIFGSTDELKLCSCMTLFERAAPDQAVFGRVLKAYFGDRRDAATLQLL